MTEIEMHIDTLEKLIPEIENYMDLYACDKSALQAALQALRRTDEHDKAEIDGRLAVLPCKVERIKNAIEKLHASNGCLYDDIGLSNDYGDCSKGCFQCVIGGLRKEAALGGGGDA